MSTVLSSTDIIREKLRGKIIIEPYEERNLSNCSYDITLGKTYFNNCGSSFEGWLNPWRKGDTSEYWGKPKEADEVVDEWEAEKSGLPIGTKYILLKPRGSILGHSNEFIGGVENITTILHARSTIGRSEITICQCAGQGDVGFINRWTLEIRNQSDVHIVLPIGIRIGQIMFFYSTKPVKPYEGKYQKSKNLRELMNGWKPEDMLPKAYLDFDIPQPKPLEESWQKLIDSETERPKRNRIEINYPT